MKCLLDTVVFLRMIFDEGQKLSPKAVDAIEDEGNELYFSAASAWEIGIKYSIGKLELKKNPSKWLPDVILKMGLRPLPVSQAHGFATMKLPFHHRDPFDRILACQTKIEGMSLITPDSIFKKYKTLVIW